MYFGTSPNVNDAWDYMMKLKKAGWDYETQLKILDIAQEIRKDVNESHFEIAELIIKDSINDISSFL
jgi:hypothetical protein